MKQDLDDSDISEGEDWRAEAASGQPQQHGVGGVDVARRTWLTVGGIGDEQDAANWAYDHVDALLVEVERLQAQVAQLTEIAHLKAYECDQLRARCASLEAVVDAARGIALRQSRTHQALRQALAAHATTTQEGTH